MPNKTAKNTALTARQLAPSQVPFFAEPEDHTFYFQQQPDGTLVHFSASVQSIMGYTAEQCTERFYDLLTDGEINTEVMDKVSLSLQGQQQAPFEVEMHHADGQLMRLELTMVPHRDDQGKLTLIDCIAHDISALHFSLSGYKRKSILLDEAEKIAGMGTWDWNMETDEVRWSKAFHEMLAITPGEMAPGMATYNQFLNDEERQSLAGAIVNAVKTHEIFEHAHRVTLRSGQVKLIESRGKTLLNAQGRPVRMIGTAHDVTERTEAQSQLERVYRLVDSSVNEVYVLDADTYRFSFVSEGGCRNLGYTFEEVTQLTPFDLCPFIPRVQIIEMIAPVLEQKEEQVIFEASHQRKDGSSYPVEVRLQYMNDCEPPMFIAIALDVSIRKEAEQAARDQAVLLRSVINASRDLIFFKDANGRYLGCNKAFERYIKMSEVQIIGQNDEQLFVDIIASQLCRNDDQVMNTGIACTAKEWVTYDDGRKVQLETTKTPYYNEAGEVEGVVGVSSNVTHHWAYEKRLKEQTGFLQSIIDSISDSIVVIGSGSFCAVAQYHRQGADGQSGQG